jgi:hypothetical protein
MKWIILLILFAVLIVIIATRFRRQIAAGIEIYKMFRQVRQQMKPPEEKQIKTKSVSKSDVPLVRCAKCGKWVKESNALNLRSKTFYCSTNCMEQAVRV